MQNEQDRIFCRYLCNDSIVNQIPDARGSGDMKGQ